MEDWMIWIVVALVCFIIEMFTFGIAVICFSVGALPAALASVWMDSWIWQIVIFAAGTVLAFVFLRPVLIKYFSGRKKSEATNADALIGRSVKVVERIDSDALTGRVVIDGVTWRAVSPSLIEVGTMVEIVSIDSITLTVIKQ